jgi:integrase
VPKQKRIKTQYAGVFYIEGTNPGNGRSDRIFYISYRKDGRKIEEKAGLQARQSRGMTAAKANQIRAAKLSGKMPTNRKAREQREAKKRANAAKWTVDRLWEAYKHTRKEGKSLATDTGRYEKYLKPAFGNKAPQEIDRLSVDRLRTGLLKKRSAQTTKHVLNLLTWIINYGVKNGLSEGISFHIKKPTVNNLKTEDLTSEQLQNLLEAIEADENKHVAAMMKLALYAGMRRGEIFKLRWSDVDFDRKFITLKDPKGGPDQKVPLNHAALELLQSVEKTESPYVFPGLNGKQRVTAQQAARRIRNRAGLPKDFRPFHGLRHVFASTLASSGKVDMYQLQKLLTHKSPIMTQRYAHLRDEALQKASKVAADIFRSPKSAPYNPADRKIRFEKK